MKHIGTFALLVVLAQSAAAQTQLTEHTYRLDTPDNRPAATLDDVAWMVGNWSGEAFGASFESHWNPQSAGSMVGFFKLLDGDTVSFYELLLLVEEEGSLSLKVKHFNPDFTAWEEKADYIDFRYVMSDDDAVHFSGISFYRVDDDNMIAYIVFRNGDDVNERKLVYRRN
ncbi:MAG: DUF6265 family protein [Woeseiaceae bacterium]|nr:DUF6265 family protein [Woeseiaceae bacterium]